MMKITLDGIPELKAKLTGFSDRRFAATIATALSRTAVLVRDDMREALPSIFDRPTHYTLNSLRTKPANAQKLEAVVDFKDETTGGGIPATYYLMPQVQGGSRRAKRLEVALRAAGALPAGWSAVPGAGARLDAYGNVERGQITQVLSQLRIQLLAGSERNMSTDPRKQIAAQRKAGGRFFVVQPGGRTQPGVYQREFMGRTVTPVFVFVKTTTYQRRFDFVGLSQRLADRHLPGQMDLAVEQQMQKLAAKQ